MQSREERPLPSVESSQKYISWHMKEMNDSLKAIAISLKSIDEVLMSSIPKESRKLMPREKEPIKTFPVDDSIPF